MIPVTDVVLGWIKHSDQQYSVQLEKELRELKVPLARTTEGAGLWAHLEQTLNKQRMAIHDSCAPLKRQPISHYFASARAYGCLVSGLKGVTDRIQALGIPIGDYLLHATTGFTYPRQYSTSL